MGHPKTAHRMRLPRPAGPNLTEPDHAVPNHVTTETV
jgi:hypothetical protein